MSKKKYKKYTKKYTKLHKKTKTKKYNKKYIKKKLKGGRCDFIINEKGMNDIIRDLIKNVPTINKPQQPYAIIMVGGPGSGKTSAQKEVILKLGLEQKDFLVVNQDYFIENVFNNNNDCYYNIELREKLKTDINYDGYDADLAHIKLLKKGLETRKNIVLDGTGRVYTTTLDNIQLLKENGYKIILCINYIHYAIGLDRIKKREKTSDRKIFDMLYVKKTYDDIFDNIPKYVRLGNEKVDRIFMFSNNGSNIKMMLDLSFDTNGTKNINCFDYCDFLQEKWQI